MAFTAEDGITEMTAFDVERVDAVGTPANGTDWLLLKALDPNAVKRDEDPDVGGGVDRDKLPASDFAGKHRSFPIVTPGDVSDAASSIGRAGDDNYSSDKLKANIIRIARRKGPKFVAQLPKSWRKKGKSMAKKMPAVQEAADAPECIPSEPLPAEAPAATAAAALPTDGGGSQLGEQTTDPGALEGQTMDNCDHGPAPENTDQQHRQDTQTQKAEDAPAAQPEPDEPKAKKAKGKKKRTLAVSAAHQNKDVAIGKRTVAALRQALGLAETFTEREQSETAAEKGTDMTHDELVALIRETNEQVKADRKAARKSAKDAKDAKEMRKLRKSAAAQSTGNRPVLADASVAAKKAAAPADVDPFAALKARVAGASDVHAGMRARKQLDTAKLINLETARREGRLPRHAAVPGTDLGDRAVPILTGSHLLPADPTIRGI